MTVRRTFLIFISAIAAAGVCVGGVVAYRTRPATVIADVLAIGNSPASVRAASCESWGVAGPVTECAFEIDGGDFARLLAGRAWAKRPAAGGSFALSFGPKLGREFPVEVGYDASTPEFKGRGRVSLVANRARTHVQLDLYED
jgi:hypothetical protein